MHFDQDSKLVSTYPTTKSKSFWMRVLNQNRQANEDYKQNWGLTKKDLSVSLRHDFILEDVGLHCCIAIDRIEKLTHDVLVHTYKSQVPYYDIKFGEGGKRILEEPNAGGTSRWSEALSFEIIFTIFNAKLLNTEMQIKYANTSKKTDYSVEIFGSILGVSVTRAMKYGGEHQDKSASEQEIYRTLNAKAIERYEEKKKQRQKPFDIDDALYLLNRKLDAVLISTEKVLSRPRWKQQILHVFCENLKIAEILRETLNDKSIIPHDLLANTIVLLTVASEDPWIFYNPCLRKIKEDTLI